MKLYPASAEIQLEFDKVKELLKQNCQSDYGKHKAASLRIHTKKEFIELALQQGHEFKLLIQNGQYFLNDFTRNVDREIKLLSIPGSTLSGEEFLEIRKLVTAIGKIFRWFDKERRIVFPALAKIIEESYFEKVIGELINEVLDETGIVKDTASTDLQKIRMSLYRKRIELNRIFVKVVARLNKSGYTADIEESFSNGRRVVAVFAEHKRQVKGILHGESDSRKTAFIEPEETIEINNDLYSLENEERKEVLRILKELTSKLNSYSSLLKSYSVIAGEFDFIAGKAKFACLINGNFPGVSEKAEIHLINAYHPLLLLYNKETSNKTIPVNLDLDEKNRILIISGPNAGGKTVTMKTCGLMQMMMQSGLLVPVHPDSRMGIFKQLLIHIGDTQSIQFELSTYSSHLLHMKYFIENANGRTLFFIDELGSGSDPNLGGAFAEVILEELSRKHAIGIVTTHYLNLKVMANRTAGIVNGAMAFDEVNLKPLYQLVIGKPGSSYTFAIAQRIGLPAPLINRARKLVDEDHFRLDKLLNRTEQDQQKLEKEKKELQRVLKENESLKAEMQQVLSKEKHRQQVELLKHQNKITEEKFNNLKETERKLKQIVLEWKKAENKENKAEVIKQLQNLLFKKKDQAITGKMAKKIENKYKEIKSEISVGTKVKMKKNHQVGEVKEIRGKRAIVQIGFLPMSVELTDLVAVEERKKE